MDGRVKKAKKLSRIDDVDATIKRKGAGDFSMVPNCIFQMGLSRIEREVWMYFHRILPWEHPVISDIPKLLEVGKTQLLDAMEKLETLNMIVVLGEGKGRVVNLPSPAYWNHPLPREIYGFKEGEKAPVDIGTVIEGRAVKRVKITKVNKSSQTGRKNRPKQDEKQNRPKQDENSSQTGRNTVPNRTKNKPENHEAQAPDASCKTRQDSSRLFKTPGSGQTSLPGVRKVGLNDLDGTLKGLYNQYVSIDVVRPIIREMVTIATHEQIADFLKQQRQNQYGLLKWDVKDPDRWFEKLVQYLNPSQDALEETECFREWTEEDEAAYRANIAATETVVPIHLAH